MKVCLDTNVFAQLFSAHSPFPQVLNSFILGRFEVLVSTEILLEYEEIVLREFGPRRWNTIWTLIQRVQTLHNTIAHVSPQFRFNVITVDPDDNKFVDCAIVGGANYVVTSDRHFSELSSSGYAVQAITPVEFATLI